MGLLQQINGKYAPETDKRPEAAKNSGLLEKAERFSPEPENFVQWAKTRGFKHAGLLRPLQKNYVLYQAYGIDAETYPLMICSPDYLAGTVRQFGVWVSFSYAENSLTKVYQLFSEKTRQQLTVVSFLRLTDAPDSPYLVLYAFDLKTELPPADNFIRTEGRVLTHFADDTDFSGAALFRETNGFNISPAYFLELRIRPIIETIFNDKQFPAEALQRRLTATLYREIYDTIASSFSFPNAVYPGKDRKIKIILFSTQQPDAELMKIHIATSLKRLLGEKEAFSIVLHSEGTSKTISGVKTFLLKD
ncbi:MAG: hypothetical protein LKF96_00280 [Treponema sp.]|jgi:hypothetical protein|nr:hypothetical protein [Treponema sp.]